MKSKNNFYNLKRWIVYGIALIAVALIYFFVLKPLAVLFNPPTQIDYGRNITELIKVIAWPIVVILSVLLLKKPLSVFMEKIASRASKLSVFKVEIELSTADQSRPLTVPSLTDIQNPDATAWTSDSSGNLFDQIQSADKADYAIIDLGTGKEWLTSRLFIFSVMLERMRGLQCIVFLNTNNHMVRFFLGAAAPKKIRWSLAQNYPWLELAYTKACNQGHEVQDIKADFTDSMIFKSSDGSLEPSNVANLVNTFLQNVQAHELDLPEKKDDWTHIRDMKWERSSWIDERLLTKILDSNLIASSAPLSLDLSESSQAKMILRRKGDYVALVNENGKFGGLVNRKALLEKLALVFNKAETDTTD